MAEERKNTYEEQVGGPTIIPDIGEFYLEVQDELKEIKARLAEMQISSAPNARNPMVSPTEQKLIKESTAGLTKAADALQTDSNFKGELKALNERIKKLEESLAEHFKKCGKSRQESLWKYPEWKNFVNNCLRVRMEHANIQVPIPNVPGSHAYSCSIVPGNIVNTNLTYPNTWFDAGTCIKYRNMPTQIAHNQIGSFCFHGDSTMATGLCTYNILEFCLVIQYFVNWDEIAFIIGFSPMTADLATQLHQDFMRGNWPAFAERNFESRSSREQQVTEATVCFRNFKARAHMTHGVHNSHALITVLISENA